MRIGWRTDNPPSVYDKYLVYLDSGEMCVCSWTNTSYLYGAPTSDWHWNIFNLPQYTKVVAWHMLPEPYKEYEEVV